MSRIMVRTVRMVIPMATVVSTAISWVYTEKNQVLVFVAILLGRGTCTCMNLSCINDYIHVRFQLLGSRDPISIHSNNDTSNQLTLNRMTQPTQQLAPANAIAIASRKLTSNLKSVFLL
jgi:hypothetical protein